ncbi:hypothetical protein, partial [Asticcacaulis sp. AC402]|uniref:hypothetical protein n=1 Tax=Asticcacaulis sp. AC402 TaxID=1282361 RepID=UPI001F2D17E5
SVVLMESKLRSKFLFCRAISPKSGGHFIGLRFGAQAPGVFSTRQLIAMDQTVGASHGLGRPRSVSGALAKSRRVVIWRSLKG